MSAAGGLVHLIVAPTARLLFALESAVVIVGTARLFIVCLTAFVGLMRHDAGATGGIGSEATAAALAQEGLHVLSVDMIPYTLALGAGSTVV